MIRSPSNEEKGQGCLWITYIYQRRILKNTEEKQTVIFPRMPPKAYTVLVEEYRRYNITDRNVKGIFFYKLQRTQVQNHTTNSTLWGNFLQPWRKHWDQRKIPHDFPLIWQKFKFVERKVIFWMGGLIPLNFPSTITSLLQS